MISWFINLNLLAVNKKAIIGVVEVENLNKFAHFNFQIVVRLDGLSARDTVQIGSVYDGSTY